MPKLLKCLLLPLTIVVMMPHAAMGTEAAPLIIQSQVKGSQEQPNVIYIMPWQEMDKIIEVEGKRRTIKLPHFKPINPKVFKEQVRFFANKQSVVKAKGND